MAEVRRFLIERASYIRGQLARFFKESRHDARYSIAAKRGEHETRGDDS